MAYALVTGASSGIGLEIAHLLAAKGYSLLLVARSQTALEKIADAIEKAHSVKAVAVPLDLGAVDSAGRLFDKTKSYDVEILVNNAGFGALGPFAEMSHEGARSMIQVNITTLTELTRLYLPSMIAKKKGRVLNVASTAAFQPGPLMAVYYASKAYVLSFSEAIAEELRGTGVTVTALCPGPTTSGFQSRAKMESVRMVKTKSLLMDSKTVAKLGLKGMFEGRPLVITGFLNRIAICSVKFTPRTWVTRLVRRIQEPV